MPSDEYPAWRITLFRLKRWILPAKKREKWIPPQDKHRGKLLEQVSSEEAARRTCHFVDIKSAEGGYKLSFEAAAIMVLSLEPDWILGPGQKEIDARP